jgi:hypothetical protein
MNIRQCACVRLGEAVQILTAGLHDDVVRDCFSVPQAQTRNAENGDDRGSSMNCLKKCLASDPVHGAAWGDVSTCQETSDHAARCGCDSLAQVTRARLSDQGKSPTAGKDAALVSTLPEAPAVVRDMDCAKARRARNRTSPARVGAFRTRPWCRPSRPWSVKSL